MNIPAVFLTESCEIEKRLIPIKDTHKKTGSAPAQKAADTANHHCRCAERAAVENQLRIQQHRRHHKCRKIVVFHSLFRKGGRQRNRSVHAQRGGYAQQTGCNDSQSAEAHSAHLCNGTMNNPFPEYADCRAEDNAQRIIRNNLLHQHREIIPYVYKLTPQDIPKLTHRCLPAYRCGCQVRWLQHVQWYARPSDAQRAAQTIRCLLPDKSDPYRPGPMQQGR